MKWTLILRPLAFTVVTALISQEIAFSFPAAQASLTAIAPAAQAENLGALSEAIIRTNFTDPLNEVVSDDSALPTVLDLDPQDPMVDADPFFIRSEIWSRLTTPAHKYPAGGADLSVAVNDGSVSILMPDQQSVLTIHQDLIPIYQTSEYLFFAGGPRIFTNARKDGQGLFFIPIKQLYGGAKVPVFFFALPGHGWIGDASGVSANPIISKELVNQDFILTHDTAGSLLPIALPDVRQIQRAQTFNYNSAMLLALDKRLEEIKNHPEQYRPQMEIIRQQTVQSLKDLVQRSRLQNNGFRFDRYASEAPEELNKIMNRFQVEGLTNAVFPARGSTLGFGLFLTGIDWDNQNLSPLFNLKAKGWFSGLMSNIRSEAVASPLSDVLWRWVRVGGIPSAIIGISVALRYTVFKKKIDAAIASGDASIGRNNKEAIMTVSAQAMSFAASFPGIWTANYLEYIIDLAGVSDHGIVRKMFDNTFGFLRSSSSKIRINHASVIRGIVALGGSDIIVTAAFQFDLIPILLKHMDVLFPSMHARITKTALELSVSSVFMTVQNVVGWLQSGSAAFAGQQTGLAMQNAISKVSADMKAEGKDPGSPKNKEEFDRRVDDAVQVEMKSLGLPGQEAFLFNSAYAYDQILAFIGYENPNGSEKANYAIKRPGKILRALLDTKNNLLKSGDSEALAVVTSALNDFSSLRTLFRDPKSFTTLKGLKNIAIRFRQVRRELCYFSFVGEMSEIDAVPPGWIARGDEAGAFRAAHAFRYALYNRLELIPDEESERAESAKKAAANEVEDPYAREKVLPEQKTITELLRAGFERWQLSRAEAMADAEFLSLTGESPDVIFNAQADQASREQAVRNQDQWSALFKRHLLETMGLNVPDFKNEVVGAVEKRVDEQFALELEQNLPLATYLTGLSTFERARLKETIRTDLFAESYVKMLREEEIVPALSPLQPGRFQKFRQNAWVQKAGKFAAFPMRLAEGVFPSTRFKRGLGNFIYRTVPMLDFQVSANKRNLKAGVFAVTIGYRVGKLWGTAMPFQKYVVQDILGGPLVTAPWTMTSEMIKNVGFKPGKSTWAMIGYGVIGSSVTWTPGIIFPLYVDSIIAGVDGMVNGGLNAVAPFVQTIIDPVMHLCSQIFK